MTTLIKVAEETTELEGARELSQSLPIRLLLGPTNPWASEDVWDAVS